MELEFFEVLWSSYYAISLALFLVAVSVLVCLGVRFDRQQQRKATEGIKDEV